MTRLEMAEKRVAELEKTLRNIVAIGDQFGASAASRLNKMRNVAERAVEWPVEDRIAA